MICPECKGRGYVKLFRHGRMSCLECDGSGIGSCCDAAGSNDASSLVKKTDMGLFAAHARYKDERFPERDCDRCGRPYRGPAVYCSLGCAVDDA